MIVAAACLTLLAGASVGLGFTWLGFGLLGAAAVHLMRAASLDLRPWMLAMGSLQRSCFGMTGYLAGLAAALAALPGTNPKRLRGAAALPLALVGYALLSLYLRAAAEQDRVLFPDMLATEGPTFFKFILHAQILYLALALGVRDRRDVRRAVTGYAAVMFVVAFVALHQHLQGDNEILRRYWSDKTPASLLAPDFTRATSLFFDPNHMGNFLAVGVLLVLGALAGPGGALRRVSLGAAAVTGAAALAVSFSLSSWLGLAAGLGVVAAFRRGWTRMSACIALVVLLGAMPRVHENLAPHVKPALLDKVESLVRLDLDARGPLGIRTSLAQAAARMFVQSPFFGLGYGSFQARVATDEALMHLTRNITYSHNSFLLILAELGLVGMAILAVVLGVHVRAFRRLARSPDAEVRAWGGALAGALVACLVFAATYGTLLYDVPLWTVLGLGMGAQHAEAEACA